jgi:diketogulonate reductase-like aldo/keto reductase
LLCVHSDLQLEYLDLYLIHWPLKLRKGSGFPPRQEDFLPLDIKSTWEALEHTVELGLTRAIGVANFSSKRLESLLQYAKIQPAVDQVEMHPGWQQQSLRYFCRSRGIHVSAMAPLGAPGTFYGRNDILILQVVLETAMRHRKTPAQVTQPSSLNCIL